MDSIHYIQLSTDNFPENALDGFIRYQEVNFTLQYNGQMPTFIETNSVEDWSLPQRRAVAKTIRNTIAQDGFAFGAVSDRQVIGFIVISTPFLGSKNQYIELKMFHISAPYRNHGIGKTLFQLGCSAAKRIGAKKLYIEAHPAKETQLAYRKFGCIDITEPIPQCGDSHAGIIQLEFQL